MRDALIQLGVNINTDAGPKSQRKKVAAIDPKTKEIKKIFESLTAAGEALHKPGTKASNVAKNIGSVVGKNNIRYGYQWILV